MRRLLRLSAAVWLTFGAAQCVQTYILASAVGRPWTLAGALTTSMPWWLSWLALTPLIGWLANRYNFNEGGFWRPLGAHIGAGIAISAVHLVVTGSIFWATTGRYLASHPTLANQVQRFFGSFFLEAIVTYAGVAGVLIAVAFARAARDKEVSRAQLAAQAAELEASLTQARLEALRMELNPHFLFNALTTIAALVGKGRKSEARDAIARLAELLRRALDGGQTQFSTIADELGLLEDYLFIQRLRFHDRLSVSVRLDANAGDCAIPTLLLMQIVENAIKHGIEPTEGRGAVAIQIDRIASSVRVAIRDTGAGFDFRHDGALKREGIGIGNTRARLHHAYGERAALCLENHADGGAEVIVVIPVGPELAYERAS